MSAQSFEDQEQASYDATSPGLLHRSIMSFRADGSLMDIANPHPDDINWRTIAKALSCIARFNGINPVGAYSVAQHSVMGADALANETGSGILAAFFLLHDAHEAFMGDWTRPSVRLLSEALYAIYGIPLDWTGNAVHLVKSRIDNQILAKAGLPVIELPGPFPQPVHDMDARMLRAETLALFGRTGLVNLDVPEMPMPKLTGAIKPWGAMKAEEQWLGRLSRYLGIDWRAA